MVVESFEPRPTEGLCFDCLEGPCDAACASLFGYVSDADLEAIKVAALSESSEFTDMVVDFTQAGWAYLCEIPLPEANINGFLNGCSVNGTPVVENFYNTIVPELVRMEKELLGNGTNSSKKWSKIEDEVAEVIEAKGEEAAEVAVAVATAAKEAAVEAKAANATDEEAVDAAVDAAATELGIASAAFPEQPPSYFVVAVASFAVMLVRALT